MHQVMVAMSEPRLSHVTCCPLCLVSRAQKYPAPVAGTVPTNVPTMYPWPGKMGENGEKWGKMGKNGEKWGGNGEKWGKMGKTKETWVVQPVPFPPISSAFHPHFPPFFPIFPHFSSGAFPIFPHFSSGAFTNAPPPQPCFQPKP